MNDTATTPASNKPKPMSDSMRRKVRKSMVDDIAHDNFNLVEEAATTGHYSVQGRDGNDVTVEDTKGVKREAKAILKSFRAWARSERKA